MYLCIVRPVVPVLTHRDIKIYYNFVGHKYLIQYSAGSGKSNSIAWLAHQLIEIEQDGRPMLDSCP